MPLHTPHILLYSLLDPLFLMHCLLPHTVLTPRSEEGRPPAPSLSPSPPPTAASLSLSPSLWVPVKNMLLALLALNILQVVLPCSPLNCLHTNWNFIFHPLTPCLLLRTPFPEKEGLFPRHFFSQPLQPSVIHSLALKSTHRL